MRRNRIVVAVAAAAVLLVGWYAFRPERLFIDETVNEPLVDEAPAAHTGGMQAAGADAGMAMNAAAPAMAGEHVAAGDAPVALAAGQFHSNAHPTHGTATIYRLSDGKQVLRLTSFETSNGPDVRVYLVAAADVNDNALVKRVSFVDLGAMKGNKGDQNYELPAGLDLEKYRAATIWCRRFSVNFGTAPLHASASRMGRTGGSARQLASAR